MAEVLQVRNLSFKYSSASERALADVSFSVDRGELLCIIGASGAGKSTLSRALVGLIPHFFPGKMDGDVFVLGENTKGLEVHNIAQRVGLVFESPFNQLSYSTMTVAEELAFGLGNIGIERSEMKKRVERVAEKVGITSLLNKEPTSLSGGEVQRVAIGSVLVMEPDILVLDEPTAQLDPIGTQNVFDIVKDLNEEGMTTILAGHEMERIAAYADRVLLLSHGEIRLLGTPREVFTSSKFEGLDLALPQYTSLSKELSQRGLWNGRWALTEEEAQAMVKEVCGPHAWPWLSEPQS
jgi:energy-coupling factor transport system ATP-binding protein